MLKIFSVFGELFTIEKLTRTGLRYVNVIPYTREKGIIPIENYLNIRIELPKSISTDFENLNMIFISQTEDGKVATHIESVISQDQTEEAIMLDFDYAKEKDLYFNSLETCFASDGNGYFLNLNKL